jgi:hypothetical protein
MARRKVADQVDAQKLLDEWTQSEVTFSAFCARRGVDGRSLRCWRMNLERSASAAPVVQLVELTTTAAPARPSYRLHVGEITVEVDDAFSEHTLARLLRVVSSC